MSDLFAIAYNDLGTALGARGKLFELQKQRLIDLEDALVVERRPDGQIKLHQANNMVAGGAVGGALWGGVIGIQHQLRCTIFLWLMTWCYVRSGATCPG